MSMPRPSGAHFIARGYSVIETCGRQGQDTFDQMHQAVAALTPQPVRPKPAARHGSPRITMSAGHL